MQVSSARMACEIVASGTGYTLCDFFVAHGTDMRKMALIPIAPKFDLEFGALWPAGEQLSAAARRLVKLVSHSANQLLDRASRAAPYSGKRKKP
jgi:DNA-binding transcriptional LysR family regulator